MNTSCFTRPVVSNIIIIIGRYISVLTIEQVCHRELHLHGTINICTAYYHSQMSIASSKLII